MRHLSSSKLMDYVSCHKSFGHVLHSRNNDISSYKTESDESFDISEYSWTAPKVSVNVVGQSLHYSSLDVLKTGNNTGILQNSKSRLSAHHIVTAITKSENLAYLCCLDLTLPTISKIIHMSHFVLIASEVKMSGNREPAFMPFVEANVHTILNFTFLSDN